MLLAKLIVRCLSGPKGDSKARENVNEMRGVLHSLLLMPSDMHNPLDVIDVGVEATQADA